jgi:hypothetical protein
VDVDNKFKGIGLNFWYDDRNSRVFLTKRDYVPVGNPCLKYNDELGFYTTCGEKECPSGYTYNALTDKCERVATSLPICPDGYTYNEIAETCTLVQTTDAECNDGIPTIPYFIYYYTILNGVYTDFRNLSPQQVKCHYEWWLANATPGGVDGIGEATAATFVPATIGTQLYGSIAPYTILTSFTGNFISFTPSRVTTLVNGIITAITPFSSLNPCP